MNIKWCYKNTSLHIHVYNLSVSLSHTIGLVCLNGWHTYSLEHFCCDTLIFKIVFTEQRKIVTHHTCSTLISLFYKVNYNITLCQCAANDSTCITAKTNWVPWYPTKPFWLLISCGLITENISPVINISFRLFLIMNFVCSICIHA